ncbi:hypothetical protein HK405_015384, partial [Cladochytrium tenue]
MAATTAATDATTFRTKPQDAADTGTSSSAVDGSSGGGDVTGVTVTQLSSTPAAASAGPRPLVPATSLFALNSLFSAANRARLQHRLEDERRLFLKDMDAKLTPRREVLLSRAAAAAAAAAAASSTSRTSRGAPQPSSPPSSPTSAPVASDASASDGDDTGAARAGSKRRGTQQPHPRPAPAPPALRATTVVEFHAPSSSSGAAGGRSFYPLAAAEAAAAEAALTAAAPQQQQQHLAARRSLRRSAAAPSYKEPDTDPSDDEGASVAVRPRQPTSQQQPQPVPANPIAVAAASGNAATTAPGILTTAQSLSPAAGPMGPTPVAGGAHITQAGAEEGGVSGTGMQVAETQR